MYCSNCGKEVRDEDNFCRYCGLDLRNRDVCEDFAVDNNSNEETEPENTKEEFVYEGEELVLYEVKRHIMLLFWTIFLTPLFLIYFWTIFLSSQSIFSWFVVAGIIVLIVYPAICYKSESFVITTKSAHIKIGFIKKEEIEIPLKDFDKLDVTQSSMGRMFDYGTVTFNYKSEKYDYPYVKSPEELLYIFQNPGEFIQEQISD